MKEVIETNLNNGLPLLINNSKECPTISLPLAAIEDSLAHTGDQWQVRLDIPQNIYDNETTFQFF